MGLCNTLHKPIIGVMHLVPLPGSAAYDRRGIGPVLEGALDDGRLLEQGGVDAILLQNTGNLPAMGDGGSATIAHLAAIGTHLRRELKTPFGVNNLAKGT